VKEVMQVVFMNLLMRKVFLTLLVNSTLLRTVMEDALLRKSAKTAPGLHAQKDKIARINAGQLLTDLIMLLTTTASEVPKR